MCTSMFQLPITVCRDVWQCPQATSGRVHSTWNDPACAYRGELVAVYIKVSWVHAKHTHVLSGQLINCYILPCFTTLLGSLTLSGQTSQTPANWPKIRTTCFTKKKTWRNSLTILIACWYFLLLSCFKDWEHLLSLIPSPKLYDLFSYQLNKNSQLPLKSQNISVFFFFFTKWMSIWKTW